MKKLVLCFILTALFLSLALVGTAAAATIYVDKNAPGVTPDGLSWDTAFTNAQQGLNAAVSGDEVWVAKGTYVEHITLKSGVALYGGFAGSETAREQRDFKVNVTTLDGTGTAGSVVFSADDTSTATRIDGFTIQNGPGAGFLRLYGGILCNNSSATIANNIISGNVGGGIYSSGSSTITNNTISGNSGSGIAAYGSTTITNNIISGNSGASGGGGIYCNGFAVTIANNIISGNSTYFGPTYGYGGGGIACYGSATIANNIISGNNAASGGGISCGSAAVTIANNTITENSVSYQGGGIDVNASATIANNIVYSNSSGIRYWYDPNYPGSPPTLINNDVYQNTAYNYTGVAPGLTDISVAPAFVSTETADYHLQAGSPCFDAGDDSVVQSGWVDMDGEARIQGAHVDIGADERDCLSPVTVSSDPKNKDSGVSVTKEITVTFSEDVVAGPNYPGITVIKGKNSGDPVNITTEIVGNTLYIRTTAALNYASTYTVFIPAGAVWDMAGNPLESDYEFYFTTER